MARSYWKIICTEDQYPGLWNTWFTQRVVAVGWAARWGFKLEGGKRDHTWSRVRACLKRIRTGDEIVVQLPNNRVGRIGRVMSLAVGDEAWEPSVPKIPNARVLVERDGEMGRRMSVAWVNVGPKDSDMVAELPREAQLSSPVRRAPLIGLDPRAFRIIRAALRSRKHWMRVVPEFKHESALSDYIAVNPTRLGAGLRAFPAKSAREHVFKNQKRSDVLLIDHQGALVVVECKQGPAEVAHLRQLHGYMRRARELRYSSVRGILVHGGPPTVAPEVKEEAHRLGITTFQHSLNISFGQTS